MRITIFSTLLLVLGVGLLAVSLAGLFIPLRNPAIYIEKANDIWHVFDPDAGVVVNHSIEQIEKNPEMIRSYYTDDFRVDQYRLANKPIYDGVKGYHGRLYFYIEILSYLFIWLLPLLLIFFSFLLKRYGIRKSIDLTVVACVLS